MNNVIIGTGNLGARHLQGLLRFNQIKQTIYLVDTNEDSLKAAITLSKEIKHNHTICCHRDITDLPSDLYFVIIATNSKIRKEIIINVLKNSDIKYLLLEKVLFPKLEDYQIVNDKIQNIKCYVNHPRRYQTLYSELKNRLQLISDEKFKLKVEGDNWHLASNILHFTDLIVYLFDDKIVKYSNKNLDNEVYSNKRSGYIEFNGRIEGLTLKGNIFEIICNHTKDHKETPISIEIASDNYVFKIDERNFSITEFNNFNKNEKEIKVSHGIQFQSNLTTDYIHEIVNFDKLSLTTYRSAMENHVLLIETLLDFMNVKLNLKSKICSIT